ncbi:hypothetical protein GEMRC1_002456 [Eukaryota sp. GEM-RC1]
MLYVFTYHRNTRNLPRSSISPRTPGTPSLGSSNLFPNESPLSASPMMRSRSSQSFEPPLKQSRSGIDNFDNDLDGIPISSPSIQQRTPARRILAIGVDDVEFTCVSKHVLNRCMTDLFHPKSNKYIPKIIFTTKFLLNFFKFSIVSESFALKFYTRIRTISEESPLEVDARSLPQLLTVLGSVDNFDPSLTNPLKIAVFNADSQFFSHLSGFATLPQIVSIEFIVPLPQTIPVDLSFPHLTTVSLLLEPSSDMHRITIPQQFRNLHAILSASSPTTLDLRYNDITGEVVSELMILLSQHFNINSLLFERCRFSEPAVTALIDLIPRFNLESVGLQNAVLHESSKQALESFSQTQHGGILSMESNFTTVLQYLRSPQGTFTSIQLANQQIDCQFVTTLCNSLRHNTTVKHVDLSSNQISSAGANYIACEVLRTNKTIKSLDLSNNPIGSEGIISICMVINTINTTLDTLCLNGIEYGAEAVGSLLNTLKVRPNLKFSYWGKVDRIVAQLLFAKEPLLPNRLNFSRPKLPSSLSPRKLQSL